DTAERLGPRRVTQSGLIAPGTVLGAALGTFAAAMAVGLYLVWVGGWPILLIGLASLVSGYAYTGGPFPLAYHGLGDVFVFVFFGLVAVTGTTYVQAGSVSVAAWAASVAVGASGTALLVVNNLRDASTDVKAGKRTWVVRFGAGAGKVEYVLLLLVALGIPLVMWATDLSGSWGLLGLLAAPLALPPLRKVMRESGAKLNPALGETARFQLVFGLLFALGLVLG
ncbi:MAG: 1,4-dihydroxy-2-naphthoate octaprenyltransferase, partial [Myxococcaceae bacterium]|nr:1,4-dihydroxy-2-naphthoate octaprenyltransferase [Myxococcaceae bacterium]